MRRNAVRLLLLLGCGLLAWAAQAQNTRRTLTVVVDDNYPPYLFRDDGGRLQGIRKDIWDLWSARTGIAVQLVGLEWAKAQQEMQAGHADVIDTIFETAARKSLYDFGPTYSDIDVPIFFHESISGIANAQSLKGFTIGVKDGDACVDFLVSQGLDNFRKYPSYEAVVDAAAVGEVRVFCEDRPPATYFLVRKQLEHQFRISPPLYVGQFHWAVRKGDAATYQLVKAGFDRISPSEVQEIQDRWMGVVVARTSGVPMAVRYGFYALLAAGAVTVVLAGWNIALRRRVGASTAELEASLRQLTQAKQQVDQTLAQLGATLEAIPDPLFELDLDGRYLDLRVLQGELLAAPREQLIGRSVYDVLPTAAADTVLQSLHEAADRGSAFGAQIRLPLPQGERWFELSVTRKRARGGQRDTFIMLSRDITDRKQAEQALARHGDELEKIVQERSRQLTEARDAADRASRAKSEFLSRMSHELRTPMNAILGFAQLIQMGPSGSHSSPPDPRTQAHVDEILRAGKHLLHILNDVLDLEQIEAGRVTLHPEAIDLRALAHDVLALMQPLASPRQIALSAADMPPLMVRADPTRLKQVVLNLVSNAIKYNRPGGGHVWLDAQLTSPERVRLSVRDDGEGIAADRMGELFEPFNRLGAEASQIEGTGIGLSLSRRLVALMGGDMGVETREGEGSTFWLTLPLQGAGHEVAREGQEGQEGQGRQEGWGQGQEQDPADGEPSRSRDGRGAPFAAPPARVATLLYIEDNTANLQLMEQIVARHRGVALLTAPLGQAGLALARSQRPDLILLDIHLPDIDGYAVLGQLRDEPALKHTPVIAITANAMPMDVKRIRDAGFDDYMAKPIRVTAVDLLIHERLGSTLV